MLFAVAASGLPAPTLDTRGHRLATPADGPLSRCLSAAWGWSDGVEYTTLAIPPELEAKILRYFHVEQWRVTANLF